ncbi:dsba oxidoreductase protein [Purpureocillium lavendulum]|uniref:Dsba oxidoreductase protein n=1 Tax=Purpureocillium lavendulum TaxID=1247861 RepID=A0AB34FUU3_9HYPO|nr:dsba oxidoreductase protein [Purpureocillium lavendulum]
MYESKVSFIMDTICPWTYIAKTKLDQALARVREDPASASAVTFSLRFRPFQLDPSFPEDVPDRQAWSLREKHMGSEEAQRAYQAHMRALAEPLGLPPLRFDGPTGNTLHAHRLIQLVQGPDRDDDDDDDDDEAAAAAASKYGGPDAAARLVDGLYRRYFGEGAHPASEETLLGALAADAGVPEAEARRLVATEGGRAEGLAEVKTRARDVARDVDAVPTVVVEGRRRDITLTGAKEVVDYVKALETVVRESK